MSIEVRETTAAACRPLRLAVLRPGLPADTPTLHDPDDGTYLAAVDDGEIVGTTVLTPRPFAERPGAPALQLTSMAVAPTRQRDGVGGRLLAAAVGHAAAQGYELLWCNARSTATGFYARHGWRIEGDEFVGAIGLPHVVMWRPAEPAAPPTSSDGVEGGDSGHA